MCTVKVSMDLIVGVTVILFFFKLKLIF